MEHSGTCSMSLNGTSHYVMEADQHALASFLTGLGVLELIGDTTVSKTFKITSPYIEMIARKRILSNFDCTLSPGDNIEPPLSQSGLLDPISLLKTALRFFNKNIMLLAPTRTWYMWMALWVSRSLEKVCTIRSCIGSCCPGWLNTHTKLPANGIYCWTRTKMIRMIRMFMEKNRPGRERVNYVDTRSDEDNWT